MGISESDLRTIQERMGMLPAVLAAEGEGLKPKRREMNKTESAFAAWLDLQQKADFYKWWAWEPLTFRLGHDCRYTPDFAVLVGSTLHLIDVKGRTSRNGRMTYYAKDDSLVKIRTAAEKYAMFRWAIVFPDGKGGWERRDF